MQVKTVIVNWLFLQNFNSFYTLYRLLLTVRKHARSLFCEESNRGPVVQSVVSLTSSLVVKMLAVLVSTIFNSRVFLLKKNISSYCKSCSHSFSKSICVYAIFNDRSFNDTLTNDIICFEQLGPVFIFYSFLLSICSRSSSLLQELIFYEYISHKKT